MPNPEFDRAQGSPSGREAPAGDVGADPSCRTRCCGPWPLAAAAIGGAFWLCPPLGIASLAYVVMRRRHGRGEGHEGRCGHGFGGRGWRRRGFGRHSSGNVAFDEARAEAWAAMQAEAEAFDDFRRRERTARDREVYDRFRSERARPAETTEPPRSGEAGTPAI